MASSVIYRNLPLLNPNPELTVTPFLITVLSYQEKWINFD